MVAWPQFGQVSVDCSSAGQILLEVQADTGRPDAMGTAGVGFSIKSRARGRLENGRRPCFGRSGGGHGLGLLEKTALIEQN